MSERDPLTFLNWSIFWQRVRFLLLAWICQLHPGNINASYAHHPVRHMEGQGLMWKQSSSVIHTLVPDYFKLWLHRTDGRGFHLKQNTILRLSREKFSNLPCKCYNGLWHVVNTGDSSEWKKFWDQGESCVKGAGVEVGFGQERVMRNYLLSLILKILTF